MVGHKVMNIVTAFPPSYRQSATKVCNENTNHGVGNKDASDTSMACIMRREHDLMLWADQQV